MVAHSVQRLGMQQLLAACLAGLLCAAVGAKADLDAVEVMLDVDLGFDNVSGFDTTADVYCSPAVTDPCLNGSSAGQGGAPLVLLYPGGTGGKEEYVDVPSILAASGYYVMVLQQLVTPVLPTPPELDLPEGPTNLVRPTATAVALDWLNEFYEEDPFRGLHGDGGYGGESMMSACLPPDTGNVLLVGHSAGAIVAKETLQADTATELDFFGFLPVPLPVYPEIKGAFLYGSGPLPGDQGPALPGQRILTATGALDLSPLNNTLESEANLVLEDLDHFSIAGSHFRFRAPELGPQSNRTFAEAQALVGEVAAAALDSMHCDTAAAPNPDLALPEYVVDAFGVEDWLEEWISWLPV